MRLSHPFSRFAVPFVPLLYLLLIRCFTVPSVPTLCPPGRFVVKYTIICGKMIISLFACALSGKITGMGIFRTVPATCVSSGSARFTRSLGRILMMTTCKKPRSAIFTRSFGMNFPPGYV